MNKTDLLFDAIEHPERFTDEELDALLSDSEIRDIYDVMSKTRDALYRQQKPDIDAEWLRFAKTHPEPRKRFILHFNRQAAAIIAGVAVSLAAVAAGIGISFSYNRNTPEAPVTEAPAPLTSSETEISGAPLFNSEDADEPVTIIFKEEKLGDIIDTIASYYGAEAVFKNPDTRNLRLFFKWDQGKELNETAEMLNSFEQINIIIGGNTITVE